MSRTTRISGYNGLSPDAQQAVLPVGLVPLHIMRVGQDDFDALFKDVEDRLPVRSRTLHDGVRAALVPRATSAGSPVPR